MVIAVIIVAVVAIAAVAGAYVLLSNGTSGGSNDNNNNNGNNQTGNGAVTPFQLQNGEFMQYTTTTASGGLDFNSTMRWEISNVTATGYDVEITFSMGASTTKTMVHANNTDTLGVTGSNGDFNKGVKVGTETLATPFGNKQVEHWQLTNSTDAVNTTTDFYIGVKSPVLYKLVTTSKGVVDPINDSVYTMVLDDTNINEIRNGNT